jgi:phosphopantothenoylcysteine synthetase/decarboxylase
MALFKRADLKSQGLTDEQIEFVMTEGNRSLANNYTLTSDVQGKIDAAVEAAKTAPVDVTNSAEYKQLAQERDMLRAIGGDDFSSVKPKFRETVYGMLDRSDNAPAVADQLKTIGEKYEEYFVSEQPAEPPAKPNFGAPTQGSAPTGKTGPSFMDTWGFVPKKQ